MRFALVFAGSGLGGVLRYLVSLASTAALGAGFPYATLLVNLGGSFAIALVMQLVVSAELRLFLVTGVLGGFTTYSAFNWETWSLAENGHPVHATLFVLATVLGCALAGGLGVLAGRHLGS